MQKKPIVYFLSGILTTLFLVALALIFFLLRPSAPPAPIKSLEVGQIETAAFLKISVTLDLPPQLKSLPIAGKGSILARIRNLDHGIEIGHVICNNISGDKIEFPALYTFRCSTAKLNEFMKVKSAAGYAVAFDYILESTPFDWRFYPRVAAIAMLPKDFQSIGEVSFGTIPLAEYYKYNFQSACLNYQSIGSGDLIPSKGLVSKVGPGKKALLVATLRTINPKAVSNSPEAKTTTLGFQRLTLKETGTPFVLPPPRPAYDADKYLNYTLSICPESMPDADCAQNIYPLGVTQKPSREAFRVRVGQHEMPYCGMTNLKLFAEESGSLETVPVLPTGVFKR